MMGRIWMIVATLLMSSFSFAQDCRYQVRPNDQLFFSLPTAIRGWVNCGESGANVIYVGKTDSMKPAELKAWIENYQAVLSPEPGKTSLLNRGNLAGGFETFWFESRRSLGSTRHLVITKKLGMKHVLLFVQTANLGTGAKPAFTIPSRLRQIVRSIDPELLDREFPLP